MCPVGPLKDEAMKVFLNSTDSDGVSADLYSGGIFLGCSFGMAALYIWAIGILAAGQSSTMTGTYSGQFVMEGFLNLQWARWKRVLFTRTIAIVPTFLVAFYSRIADMTMLNDYLNVVMSLQLPFAAIPTVAFTSSAVIMGEFVNGMANRIVSVLLCFVVIGINLFLVNDTVQTYELSWQWVVLIGELWSIYTVTKLETILARNESRSVLCPGQTWKNPAHESIDHNVFSVFAFCSHS